MSRTEHCVWENFEEFQYSVLPDTINFTLHSLHLDEISSDYQYPDRRLHTHCTQPVQRTAHCQAVLNVTAT